MPNSISERVFKAGSVGRMGLDFSEKLIFERTDPGRRGIDLPAEDVQAALGDDDVAALMGEEARAFEDAPVLPEVSEPEIMRHYVRMSRWNFAIDLNTYPLGSCTMKYNPKINEWAGRLPGFTELHPYMPEDRLQGALALMHDLQAWLSEIGGFVATTLQPSAGAHGELLGVMMMRAAHDDRGEARSKILVPDSAHGTNPATAALNGYKTVPIKQSDTGILRAADVAAEMDAETAGIMITNPNTLGIFEEEIVKIAEIVHEKGGFVYGDGANLNAIMGIARPGDLGIDVMHYNLHKTFTIPHGGGGPGCGAVGVSQALEPYLPTPLVGKRDDGSYFFDSERPKSIGRIRSFHGNFGMQIRAWTYIRENGAEGIKRIAEAAVLNANYIRARLEGTYHLPFNADCLHEVVFTDKNLKETGVTTMDVAKRLMDHGFHPPTVYFPLVVQAALMIEPTETETISNLDRLCDAFIDIAKEAQEDPETVKSAPHHTAHKRFDEAFGARFPVLKWEEGLPRGGEEYKAWAKAHAKKK
jgi:glycine dehydrogenase subunit 2